ncbi:hypothetical protein U1Q18_019349 [Sarracenia purpurea var. burkii]
MKTKESLTPLLKALPNAGSYKLHRRSSLAWGGSWPLLFMEADAEPSTLINQGSDPVHYQGKITDYFPTGPIPEHWNLAEQLSGEECRNENGVERRRRWRWRQKWWRQLPFLHKIASCVVAACLVDVDHVDIDYNTITPACSCSHGQVGIIVPRETMVKLI